MNETQIKGRLGWLGSALVVQRGRLAGILGRLRGFGARACTSFGVQRKFALLLEQVAFEKEKEIDIINEIEAVEKHHQEMKRLRKLRRAEAQDDARPARRPVVQEAPKPERSGLARLLWLYYMLSQSGIRNKKQGIG